MSEDSFSKKEAVSKVIERVILNLFQNPNILYVRPRNKFGVTRSARILTFDTASLGVPQNYFYIIVSTGRQKFNQLIEVAAMLLFKGAWRRSICREFGQSQNKSPIGATYSVGSYVKSKKGILSNTPLIVFLCSNI